MVHNHEGKKSRQDFVNHVNLPELNDVWETYLGNIDLALQECAQELEPILEGEYGLCAMHTGTAPSDWVKPASNPAANQAYRRKFDDMQSARDVIERGELKRPKFLREQHLFERKANITNHV